MAQSADDSSSAAVVVAAPPGSAWLRRWGRRLAILLLLLIGYRLLIAAVPRLFINKKNLQTELHGWLESYLHNTTDVSSDDITVGLDPFLAGKIALHGLVVDSPNPHFSDQPILTADPVTFSGQLWQLTGGVEEPVIKISRVHINLERDRRHGWNFSGLGMPLGEMRAAITPFPLLSWGAAKTTRLRIRNSQVRCRWSERGESLTLKLAGDHFIINHAAGTLTGAFQPGEVLYQPGDNRPVVNCGMLTVGPILLQANPAAQEFPLRVVNAAMSFRDFSPQSLRPFWPTLPPIDARIQLTGQARFNAHKKGGRMSLVGTSRGLALPILTTEKVLRFRLASPWPWASAPSVWNVFDPVGLPSLSVWQGDSLLLALTAWRTATSGAAIMQGRARRLDFRHVPMFISATEAVRDTKNIRPTSPWLRWSLQQFPTWHVIAGEIQLPGMRLTDAVVRVTPTTTAAGANAKMPPRFDLALNGHWQGGRFSLNAMRIQPAARTLPDQFSVRLEDVDLVRVMANIKQTWAAIFAPKSKAPVAALLPGATRGRLTIIVKRSQPSQAADAEPGLLWTTQITCKDVAIEPTRAGKFWREIAGVGVYLSAVERLRKKAIQPDLPPLVMPAGLPPQVVFSTITITHTMLSNGNSQITFTAQSPQLGMLSGGFQQRKTGALRGALTLYHAPASLYEQNAALSAGVRAAVAAQLKSGKGLRLDFTSGAAGVIIDRRYVQDVFYHWNQLPPEDKAK